MSWKPAVDRDAGKQHKEENKEISVVEKTFNNMDRVDRRDKMGRISSFGGFGDSPFFKKIKQTEGV